MRIRVIVATLTVMAAGLCFITPRSTDSLSAGAANAPSSQQRITYEIDSGRSRFIVRAFAGGLFSIFAHDHTISVKDFSGSAQISGPALEQASLQMKVKADSLVVIDKVSEKDKKEIESAMRDKVLEASKYPEITFTGARASASKVSNTEYQVSIEGDLNLHGVTRRESIAARVTLDGNELRARGEFPLKQTNYKITPVKVAGGTVRVKDELRLSFDIIAVRR